MQSKLLSSQLCPSHQYNLKQYNQIYDQTQLLNRFPSFQLVIL